MKIMQIVTQMEAGGAQRVAHLLQREFAEREHASTLVFLYTKRPAYDGAEGTCSLLDHPPSALEYLKILGRLARLLLKERPDVVITHTHYANIMGGAVAWLCGVPSRIAVLHNPVDTFPAQARKADRIFGIFGVYTNAVAVSRTVAASVSHYASAYRRRLSIIFNGIPLHFVSPSRDVTRRQWKLPPDATLLVNVGRFSRQKNQEFLLRLLVNNDLHLLLVGDGELHSDLRRTTAELGIVDRVHFTGEVSPADVNALIACSDIFVLPSLFEAVGMVVLEAMAVGVPVLSSDIPSSHEFIGEDGFILDLAKPDTWLALIQRLMDEPELSGEVARRAKVKVQAYTVARMAESYEDLATGSAHSPFGPGLQKSEELWKR